VLLGRHFKGHQKTCGKPPPSKSFYEPIYYHWAWNRASPKNLFEIYIYIIIHILYINIYIYILYINIDIYILHTSSILQPSAGQGLNFLRQPLRQASPDIKLSSFASSIRIHGATRIRKDGPGMAVNNHVHL
jgi:hypothetical protein